MYLQGETVGGSMSGEVFLMLSSNAEEKLMSVMNQSPAPMRWIAVNSEPATIKKAHD